MKRWLTIICTSWFMIFETQKDGERFTKRQSLLANGFSFPFSNAHSAKKQLVRLEHSLEDCIKHGEDHVLIFDLGPASRVNLKFKSLGKSFELEEKGATII